MILNIYGVKPPGVFATANWYNNRDISRLFRWHPGE